MKKLIYSICLIGIISCTSRNSTQFIDISRADLLTPERTVYSTDSAGILGDITIKGDILILLDQSQADQKLIAVDKKTGREISRFGNKGKGPGELIQPAFIENENTYNGTDVIDIHDYTRLMKYTYDISDPENAVYVPAKDFVIPADLMYLSYHNIVENSIIGKSASLKKEGLFNIYDMDSKTSKWVDYYPMVENMEIMKLNWGCDSKLAAKGKGDVIIAAMTFFDLIQVYDWQGKLINKYSFTKDYVPVYDEEALPMYTLDHYVGNDYCYILRSNRDMIKAQNKKGQELILIDWSGKIAKTYFLKDYVRRICVDEAHKKLYGLTSDELGETYSVVEYNLGS